MDKLTKTYRHIKGFLHAAIWVLLITGPLPAAAQFYPETPRIKPSQEASLLNNLAELPDSPSKIEMLIDLSNLYFNKPYKIKLDLNRSLFYALQARKLSLKYRDTKGLNDAAGRIADVYLWQNNFKEAVALLPALNDTSRLNLLLQLGFSYANTSVGADLENAENSMLYVAKAREMAIKLGNKQAILQTDLYTAEVHIMEGKYLLAQQELNELIGKYRAIGYTKLHYVYRQFRILYMINGNADKYLEYALKAVNTMNATRDTLMAGDFYFALATAFKDQGQYDKSREFFERSLSSFNINGGFGSVYYSIAAIADVYINKHQFVNALSYLQNTLRQFPTPRDNDEVVITSSFADCYLKLKMFPEAEKYFLKEFNLYKSRNALTEYAYRRLAFFYIESKNYAKARPLIYQALKLQNGFTEISTKGYTEYIAFLTDSAAGDYLSAIRHLSKNKLYDDTLYKQKKVAATQKLLVQYESGQKNQRIMILEQQGQLQEAKLKQANVIRDVTIGGIVISIAIGLIFYRQSKQRQLAAKIISHKNEQLERLLSEKEWLLKEVHHRVKNNLHTVICLLEIQAEFLKDDALKAIENSQHRIYAMSLIHQKLYMAEDVKSVNMAEYLPELVSYLKDSFLDKARVHFDLNIEPIMLNVLQAMPLGLIVNEAVTNSIKYAFPKKQNGKISISLRCDGDHIILLVSDDGKGFRRDEELEKQSSLGLKLMQGLSDDINAELTFLAQSGTHIRIIFPYDLTEENYIEPSIFKEREG
jgi:two-component sensor histidine kinase